MAKKKAFGIPKTLSDGIAETISTANNNIGQLRYEIVSLDRIELDPANPRDMLISKQDAKEGVQLQDAEYERKQKELHSLQSLARSIKKAGVRNPIELYRAEAGYVLISGERRVLGSILAGKTEIPAKILDSKPGELQLRFLQWIENIEREDLNIWERLDNIEQLQNAHSSIDNSNGANVESLSEIIGCSKKQAKRYLDVISAPYSLKESLKEAGIIDLIKLALIVNVKDKKQQSVLLEEAAKGASREDLNTSLKSFSHHKSTLVLNKKNGRGRPVSTVSIKIPLEKASVIQQVVECVLSHEKYLKHTRQQVIDWSNASHIKKAFQAMFDAVEKAGKASGDK